MHDCLFGIGNSKRLKLKTIQLIGQNFNSRKLCKSVFTGCQNFYDSSFPAAIVIPFPGIGSIMTQFYTLSRGALLCPQMSLALLPISYFLWYEASYQVQPNHAEHNFVPHSTHCNNLAIDQRYLPSQLENLSQLSRARIGKLRVPTLPLFLKWNTARLSLRRNTELGSNF